MAEGRPAPALGLASTWQAGGAEEDPFKARSKLARDVPFSDRQQKPADGTWRRPSVSP